MSEVTVKMVMELRDATNISAMECSRALAKYNGDMLLAEGYLKYNGCAIKVDDYEKWVDDQAQGYKRRMEENE
jgi:translation elongation factor EF-Ts